MNKHNQCECWYSKTSNHEGSALHARGLRIVAAVHAGETFRSIAKAEGVSAQAIHQLAQRNGYSAGSHIASRRQQKAEEGITGQLSVMNAKWPRLFGKLQEYALPFELIRTQSKQFTDQLCWTKLLINGHLCLLRRARLKAHQNAHYIQIHRVRYKEAFDFVLFWIPETRQWLIFPRPDLPAGGTMFCSDGAFTDRGYTRHASHDYHKFMEGWRFLSSPERPIPRHEQPTKQEPAKIFLSESRKSKGPTEQEVLAFLKEREWQQTQAEWLDDFERAI